MATAAAATSGVIRAESGQVSAAVRFRSDFTGLRLEVTRAGAAWRSGSLGRTFFGPPRLRARDLDADGEPEIVLDTYSGGAHCCTRTRVFRWLPARRAYATTTHGWGNLGYRAKNLDGRGRVELVSGDDRFAYAFTSFAGSYFPMRIWHFEGGRFRDVTRRFPGQVEIDARTLWRTYTTDPFARADPRGVLAAWLAEQYLLGRGEASWSALEAAYRRGELGPAAELAGWPQGRAYLRAVEAFLRKLGYAR